MFFLQMSGFPGAGKSTLAREIATKLAVVIIDHDVTKSSLMKSLQAVTDPQMNVGKIAYELDFDLVEYYLSLGQNVILDSPCLYEEVLTKGLDLVEKYNADYKYIECTLDDFQLTNVRLSERHTKASQITKVSEEKIYLHTLNQIQYPINYRYITIDTKQSLNEYINCVIDYLEEDL